MTPLATALVLSALGGVLHVRAGTSTVQCQLSANWLDDAQGHTPCDQWASVLSVCDSTASIAPLQNGGQYSLPTNGSKTFPCICNNDVYNLMAGCAFCQKAKATDNITWPLVKDWTTACGTDFASQFKYSVFCETATNLAACNAVSLPNFVTNYRATAIWEPFAACSVYQGFTSDQCRAFLGISKTSTYSPIYTTGGPVNGGDDRNHPSGGDYLPDAVNDVAVGVGVTFGILLGLPLLASLVAWIVFCQREESRQRFYRPLAEYYQKGGAPPPTAINTMPFAPAPVQASPYAQVPPQAPTYAQVPPKAAPFAPSQQAVPPTAAPHPEV